MTNDAFSMWKRRRGTALQSVGMLCGTNFSILKGGIGNNAVRYPNFNTFNTDKEEKKLVLI